MVVSFGHCLSDTDLYNPFSSSVYLNAQLMVAGRSRRHFQANIVEQTPDEDRYSGFVIPVLSLEALKC